MKIIELRAENIKRLVAVTIKPDGNIVEITGKNGQGKTSVLDAIWWALEGQKNIQAVPIRKGATSAKIRLDLGELKITRTFGQARDPKTKEPTGDFTTSIVVENTQGARFPSPQAVIDGLLGALSFDPLAFTRMKPGEQLETLKRFVPDVDFEAIDRANKADFDKRTDLNRQAKVLRANESAIVISESAPKQAVDEVALTEKLDAAGKQNADLETQKLRRLAATETIERLREDARKNETHIAKLMADVELFRENANRWKIKASELEEQLAKSEALPDPINTAAIKDELSSARKVNAEYSRNESARRQKIAIGEQAAEVEKKAAELTQAIERRKQQKEDAIAAAKMPIDGIGFGDGAVLMNGIPFDQASDAEQLRASIAIAAAMNPKLRVIRVRDGSLLDTDAMKLLAEFADAHDLQIWIERVDSTGKVGFVLEDGQLKQSEPAEVAV